MPQPVHFDVGNSSDGPIGLCARVWANSREEACEVLREALTTEVEEYINVYLNDAVICKPENIDDWEDVGAT